MSKKDRYSHLGGDADDEETPDEPAEAVADESAEEVEDASEEVEAESTEEVEEDSTDETESDSTDEIEEAPVDEIDDGGIRVTISDGDDEHEVVIDAEAGVTTDDVVHAVQHAGREEETRPKTMWGSWIRMSSSVGRARLVALTGVGVVTVKGLTMALRRLRQRRD